MYSPPFEKGQRILELGGGDTPLLPALGFANTLNLDIKPGPKVHVVADASEKLPFEDEAFDGVFSRYLWEHISWRKTESFAREVFRVLRQRGQAVFIVPNTLEQCRVIVERDKFDKGEAEFLFGGQDYNSNAHAAGFSKDALFAILTGAGFSTVRIMKYPDEKARDLIVEAEKMDVRPIAAHTPEAQVSELMKTSDGRTRIFDKEYFNGGKKFGGYAREGYRDFPDHWITYAHLKKLKPKSVLEIGAGRGYVIKRFADLDKIPVKGLEISKHCHQTRVIQELVTHDVAIAPWPIKDKEYDFAFSLATLEHIPEEHIQTVMDELARTTERGIHGIDFGDHEDGFDKSHILLRSKMWWERRLPPGHSAVSKHELEDYEPGKNEYDYIPTKDPDNRIKLNIGCGQNIMFHHGWVNIDVHDFSAQASRGSYRFVKHDVRTGLPFDSGIVELIFASHFLEHLTYDEATAFLRECHRVFKPGGLIRVIVPDINRMAREYLESGVDALKAHLEISDGVEKAASSAQRLYELIAAGDHKTFWDVAAFETAFEGAGFSECGITQCVFRESSSEQMLAETTDMFPNISLIMEAVKS